MNERERFGTVWNGLEWNGMEWNGMEWNGIAARVMYIERPVVNSNSNQITTQEDRTEWLLKDGDKSTRVSYERSWRGGGSFGETAFIARKIPRIVWEESSGTTSA